MNIFTGYLSAWKLDPEDKFKKKIELPLFSGYVDYDADTLEYRDGYLVFEPSKKIINFLTRYEYHIFLEIESDGTEVVISLPGNLKFFDFQELLQSYYMELILDYLAEFPGVKNLQSHLPLRNLIFSLQLVSALTVSEYPEEGSLDDFFYYVGLDHDNNYVGPNQAIEFKITELGNFRFNENTDLEQLKYDLKKYVNEVGYDSDEDVDEYIYKLLSDLKNIFMQRDEINHIN